jgi:uncharacterized protein
MQMTGQRTVPVTPRQTWDALNDPTVLKACIAGCESIALVAPDLYELVMNARIGPVSARFKGRLTRSDVDEPRSYRITFDGQGGAAGFGKGVADVRLSEAPGGTLLDYEVSAQVGGKIAQIGSRLIDGAARKIADDFFSAFEAKLVGDAAAATAAGTAATTGAEASVHSGAISGVETGVEAGAATEPLAPGAAGVSTATATATGAGAGTALPTPGPGPTPAPGAPAGPAAKPVRWGVWALAAVLAAVLLAWLLKR